MVNFKRMDEKDFVFLNKPLTEKEEKAFSDFLKSKRAKTGRKIQLNTKKIKYKEIAHNA